MGVEDPDGDRIQGLMVVLFLVVWGADSFVLNYSTFLVRFVPDLLRASLSVISLATGGFLLLKSHTAVFSDANIPPKLLDSGVYSRVRHPMYLGTLLVLFGFFLALPSLFSLAILTLFFILYDRMATYEEKNLISIVGEEYASYQRRVPKWLPRVISKK